MPPVSSSGIQQQSPEKLAVAVIPARYQSVRLPGKPLVDIGGRPMIEHVYRRAEAARSVRAVIVATDDERIRAAVGAFGGRAVLTDSRHRSGTDRVAEVAASLDAAIIVNLQGDEPLIEPDMIDLAVASLVSDADVVMSTVCRRIDDPAELMSPHVVKVVVDRRGDALYFSRALIPAESRRERITYKHIGLYVYRRDHLLQLARLPPAPLEMAESLEQLRALEHGYPIRVVETTFDSIGVDTPADLDRVRRLLAVGARV